MNANLIITNARVLTMDASNPRADSVAIRDDRILAVGEAADILALSDSSTLVIDAKGATLLPGFVESHLHLFSGAYGETLLQLADVSGLEALGAAVARYSDENPNASLLFAQGADYSILGTGQLLDRHVLDEICPDRPLLIMAYDFHSAFANTAALRAAGLLEGRDLPAGNAVVMGADGLANGELHEKLAFLPVLDLRNSGGREMLGMSGSEPPETLTPSERSEDRDYLRLGLKHAARHGITSMHNMDGNRYMLELLTEIEQAGELCARVGVPFHLTPEMDLSELDRASAMTKDFANLKLSSGYVKMFLDGVIESGTAALVAPYHNHPDHCGETLFTHEAFIKAAIEVDRRGLQIAVHAIGDAAVRLALDGYEAAAKANGPRDRRHRIEHIEVIHPDDLPRLAELGVVASMQPPHVPTKPNRTTDGIGPDRSRYAYAWRDIVDSGAVIALSSDWPIVPISPLAGIQSAMTRRNWADEQSDQRLELMEVLAAYTRNGAYVGFMEGETGTLRAGMKADLVLLSGNIEATPVDEIADMDIALTICDGQITHQQ